MMIRLAQFAAAALMWLIYVSCKKRFIGELSVDGPCVVLLWHERLYMMPFVYKRWWVARNRAIRVIMSRHKHGDIAAGVGRLFGLGAIRGSSRNGAFGALKEAFRTIKSGIDVGITPDGPKGPIHSISDGSVAVAQKCGVPVVVLSYALSSFWEFNSWDKLKIAKPFSTITYAISEPFRLDGMGIDEAKGRIRAEFEKVEKRCLG